jgi:hypothetical protein
MQVRYKTHVGFGKHQKFYIVTIRDDNNCTTVRATTMSQVKKIRKQCRREVQSDLPPLFKGGSPQ